MEFKSMYTRLFPVRQLELRPVLPRMLHVSQQLINNGMTPVCHAAALLPRFGTHFSPVTNISMLNKLPGFAKLA